jgi:hypothetical protein
MTRAGAVFIRWMSRQIPGVTVNGVKVSCVAPDSESFGRIRELATAALHLLEDRSPRTMHRMRRHVDHIRIDSSPLHGYSACWDSRLKLIEVDLSHVLKHGSAYRLADTLVHETTHAWLDSLGFVYREDRRARTEAICIRAQASFARAFTDGGPTAEYYEAQATRILADPSWLSDEAFRERQVEALKASEQRIADSGIPVPVLHGLRAAAHWLDKKLK